MNNKKQKFFFLELNEIYIYICNENKYKICRKRKKKSSSGRCSRRTIDVKIIRVLLKIEMKIEFNRTRSNIIVSVRKSNPFCRRVYVVLYINFLTQRWNGTKFRFNLISMTGPCRLLIS